MNKILNALIVACASLWYIPQVLYYFLYDYYDKLMFIFLVSYLLSISLTEQYGVKGQAIRYLSHC